MVGVGVGVDAKVGVGPAGVDPGEVGGGLGDGVLVGGANVAAAVGEAVNVAVGSCSTDVVPAGDEQATTSAISPAATQSPFNKRLSTESPVFRHFSIDATK